MTSATAAQIVRMMYRSRTFIFAKLYSKEPAPGGAPETLTMIQFEAVDRPLAALRADCLAIGPVRR